MSDLETFSINVANYKSFGAIPSGFGCVKKVNLIVGRNNSGKSALLDVIDYCTQSKFDVPQPLWHSNEPPQFIAESPLQDHEIQKVFRRNTSGGGINGDHYQFGSRFRGIILRWNLANNEFIETPESETALMHGLDVRESFLSNLAKSRDVPLSKKVFLRISAERNVVPESDDPGNNKPDVQSDGRGVTNIIQKFINRVEYPRELVEQTLLADLNRIFSPDAVFEDIVCELSGNGTWEIYLREESKGQVALSQSGSGIKTVIMVLVYIHLMPYIQNSKLANYVFAFEELENNLHPALLRRLLSYLYKKSVEEDCVIFLTTHSNVEIDQFNRNTDAQIIHVTHDGDAAICRTVNTYIDNCGVLDDLDVRASDLLQANGVIWVEGPSDRVYINRWIELWSDGELKEGTHYQCIFYGGRLLSHLSSEEPEAIDDAVAILRVNRNAVLVMDSDKRNHQTHINATKKRMQKEIEDIGGYAWVTQGREIENYLPADAVSELLGSNENDQQVNRYGNFFDYLNDLKSGEGDYYFRQKPFLAEKLSPHITRESFEQTLDLSSRLDAVGTAIERWNAMS